MNSTEQFDLNSQRNPNFQSVNETFFSQMKKEDMAKYYEELKTISLDYDPFFSPIPPKEWKEKITAAGLGKFIGDPFGLTNELLYRLDLLDNELKKEI